MTDEELAAVYFFLLKRSRSPVVSFEMPKTIRVHVNEINDTHKEIKGFLEGNYQLQTTGTKWKNGNGVILVRRGTAQKYEWIFNGQSGKIKWVIYSSERCGYVGDVTVRGVWKMENSDIQPEGELTFRSRNIIATSVDPVPLQFHKRLKSFEVAFVTGKTSSSKNLETWLNKNMKGKYIWNKTGWYFSVMKGDEKQSTTTVSYVDGKWNFSFSNSDLFISGKGEIISSVVTEEGNSGWMLTGKDSSGVSMKFALHISFQLIDLGCVDPQDTASIQSTEKSSIHNDLAPVPSATKEKSVPALSTKTSQRPGAPASVPSPVTMKLAYYQLLQSFRVSVTVPSEAINGNFKNVLEGQYMRSKFADNIWNKNTTPQCELQYNKQYHEWKFIGYDDVVENGAKTEHKYIVESQENADNLPNAIFKTYAVGPVNVKNIERTESNVTIISISDSTLRGLLQSFTLALDLGDNTKTLLGSISKVVNGSYNLVSGELRQFINSANKTSTVIYDNGSQQWSITGVCEDEGEERSFEFSELIKSNLYMENVEDWSLELHTLTGVESVSGSYKFKISDLHYANP